MSDERLQPKGEQQISLIILLTNSSYLPCAVTAYPLQNGSEKPLDLTPVRFLASFTITCS